MKRNKFSLSHYKLMTGDMGNLMPCALIEVLPGDTIQQTSSVLVRVSPLLAPVMHPVDIRVHHWFVPHRLVFDDWEPFITGGPDGFDATQFPTVNINLGNAGTGSLADYLGARPPTTGNGVVSALPFRCYNLIWNEYYRDQDLEPEAALETTAGNDGVTNKVLLHCAWEKDYFTSARPWTQKGPEVTIPLQGNAPISGLGMGTTTYPLTNQNVNEAGGVQRTYATAQDVTAGTGNSMYVEKDAATTFPNIFADLSRVAAANINDLRLAFALQRWEEARAQWGSRYTEYLAYYGVRSSDARLQRPEYLGGGKQTIQFSEVLQTSPTEDGVDTVGVGNLRGHGIGTLRSNRYRRFFEEHGYILSLLSLRPKTIYTQGTARTWNRRVKEDFWQRELEHVGQQEIHNKELYMDDPAPDGVFGYQDRYDEYRRMESQVAGEFRQPELDFWHMARQFAAPPVLNASFVSANPTKRIHAVQDNHVLWMMVRHSIQARRMLSKIGRSYIF